ncbi:hypothetical protein [Pseudomonas sp. R37(2017)]|uniref:hypothetical protein n=1 Tax=Pseudomonas sp. R37(2017) TaxID=1981685 RepID=UPI002113AE16|nr:hypothetical protein [Pseudomonas sp. R37(2017)]
MSHFPNWMLQSAHSYLKAAEVLDAQNLPHVAQRQCRDWHGNPAQELYFRT